MALWKKASILFAISRNADSQNLSPVAQTVQELQAFEVGVLPMPKYGQGLRVRRFWTGLRALVFSAPMGTKNGANQSSLYSLLSP